MLYLNDQLFILDWILFVWYSSMHERRSGHEQCMNAEDPFCTWPGQRAYIDEYQKNWIQYPIFKVLKEKLVPLNFKRKAIVWV